MVQKHLQGGCPMSFNDFPSAVDQVDSLQWETYEPYFTELQQRDILDGDLRQWLEDWSRLSALLWEAEAVVYIEKTLDTADTQKEQDFLDFVDNVQPSRRSCRSAAQRTPPRLRTHRTGRI